jgi:predicted transposase YdaD
MEMTLVLAGLRLGKETIQHFRESLKSMTTLKESSYYQIVHGEGLEEGLEKGLKEGLEKGLEEGLEKGKIAGARTILFRLGEVRFGKPNKTIRAAIEAIDELDRLEKMTERILTAKGWRELIDQSMSDRN